MRPNLRYHDIDLIRGLNTVFREEDRTTTGLNRAENVDTFDIFRAISKMPGTDHLIDLDGSNDRDVFAIHPFEYVDLLGVTRRRLIAHVDNEVYGVTDTGASIDSLALIALSPAAISHTVSRETSSAVTFLDEVYFTIEHASMQWDGDLDRGFYWGFYGPAEFPFDTTVIANFDSGETWSAVNASTTTPTNDTIGRFSNTSKAFDHSGTAGTFIAIQQTGQSHNFQPTVANTEEFGYLWLFIPNDRIADMEASTQFGVEVRLGNSGLTNADVHGFNTADLAEGWNLLEMDLANPESTIGGGATLTNVDTVQIRINFKSGIPGNVREDYRASLLYVIENGKPAVAIGAAGTLTGTFRYRVTFVDDEGFESNAGPISAAISPSSQQVNLTEIPASQDARIVARRVYRDANDGVFLRLTQINNNVTLNFTDNTADLTGNPQPPLAATSFDHSPPPAMKKVVQFNSRVFGISKNNPFRLLFSELNQPRSFPLLNLLDFEEEITNIDTHSQGLLVWTNDRTFVVNASGSTFAAALANDQLGCNGPKTAVRVKGSQIVMHEDRVFILPENGLSDPWFINGPVFDKFRTAAKSDLKDAFMVHDRGRFRVLFFLRATAGGDFDRVLFWQYGTQGFSQIGSDGPGTDPQDIRVGGWFEIVFPSAITPTGAGVIELSDSDEPEVILGSNERARIYKLNEGTKTNWDTSSSTTAVIDAVIETAPFPLGVIDDPRGGWRMAPDGRGEVRSIAFNAESTTASSWTVTVEYLSNANGEVIGSASRTVTLGDNDRAPVSAIPPAGVRAQWARVRLQNNTASQLGTIKSMRVYYIPRGDFIGERAA